MGVQNRQFTSGLSNVMKSMERRKQLSEEKVEVLDKPIFGDELAISAPELRNERIPTDDNAGTKNDRTIYLASNIEEVYYYIPPKDTLKNYLSSTFQTTDDGIKHLTDIMNNTGTLKDGGTKIYKSSKYDTTIITCHTIAGNRDIYIGDYSMQFDNDSMCKSN